VCVCVYTSMRHRMRGQEAEAATAARLSGLNSKETYQSVKRDLLKAATAASLRGLYTKRQTPNAKKNKNVKPFQPLDLRD